MGYALVDTICVCVSQMGQKRWKMYHNVARQAILKWDECFLVPDKVLSDAHEGVGEGRSALTHSGLVHYDASVKDVGLPSSSSFSSGIKLSLDLPPIAHILSNCVSSESNVGEHLGVVNNPVETDDFQNPSIHSVLNQNEQA